MKSLTGDTFVMRTLMWRASIALTDDLKLVAATNSLVAATKWLGDAVRAVRIDPNTLR